MRSKDSGVPRQKIIGANRASKDPWSGLVVDLACAQSESIFYQIYNHFAPRVKSYAMRGGCSMEFAEEVAQETLITVWQKSHLFKPERAMASTWIFTIARNKKIDKLRKMGRPAPRIEDMYSELEDSHTPEKHTQSSQNKARVHQALANLPENQSDVLRMAFIEENPHRVIAHSLGIPLGTVKSRIRLGLEKLSSELTNMKKDFQ